MIRKISLLCLVLAALTGHSQVPVVGSTGTFSGQVSAGSAVVSGSLNAGPTTAASVNSMVNATLAAGSDIGAKVNAALAACNYTCTVYVPASTYIYTTTIVLPLIQNGAYGLTLDAGAILNYQGNGDGIFMPISTLTGPGASHLILQGGTLNGTSTATAGVHISPTNGVTVQNMIIGGFSSGDGIRIEGTNNSTIQNNQISGNLHGVELVPTFCLSSTPYTCGPGVSGNPFAPNAIRIWGNKITNNSGWGIFDNTIVVGGGLTEALNNSYFGNNLELNGTGSIYEQRTKGTIISANYFESSPRAVVLGVPGGGSGFESYGTVVRDNLFTTETATPYNVELQNTDSAQIEGNTENTASTSGANCFLNQTSTMATNTYFGVNFINQQNAGGNIVCTTGAASTMNGTGSFQKIVPTFLTYLVSGNWITNSSTSEVISGLANTVVPGSYCFATPHDGSAAAVTTPAVWGAYSVWVTAGTGQVTLNHPANDNVHLDIYCVPTTTNN